MSAEPATATWTRKDLVGIEDLTREEGGYWLGMAIHRKRPRRVLAALRMLLTSN